MLRFKNSASLNLNTQDNMLRSELVNHSFKFKRGSFLTAQTMKLFSKERQETSSDPIAKFRHQIIHYDTSSDIQTLNIDTPCKWEKVSLNFDRRSDETLNQMTFVHGSNIYGIGGWYKNLTHTISTLENDTGVSPGRQI